MNVYHGQIISRGLSNHCPNCGAATLFKAGTVFELNRECAACGLKIEKDEGFFLGAMALNYGVTIVVYLVPVVLLWHFGVVSGTVAVVAALVGSFVVPVIFYRSSRSWQLMLYYSFFPQHLPANRRELRTDEDENV
jgi:uncharacterized protein (DUF983 family)